MKLPVALEKHIDAIRSIGRQHHVARMYAFGSVCTDRFDQQSDIDLMVTFDREYFDGYSENISELSEQLKALFQREVDIVPEHTLRNPYFIRKAEETKVLLYG